jgi:hypothetical protein
LSLLTLEIFSALAMVAAIAALAWARRLARRLEQVTESYWELRYEHGQLRARVARLEPADPEPPLAPPASTTFVPLSSMKR